LEQLLYPHLPLRRFRALESDARVEGAAESRTSTSRSTCARLTVSLPRPHALPRSKGPWPRGVPNAQPQDLVTCRLLAPSAASQPSWRRYVTSSCFENVEVTKTDPFSAFQAPGPAARRFAIVPRV